MSSLISWGVSENHIQNTNITNFRNVVVLKKSPGRAVGKATGYGLDDRRVGVRVTVGVKNFHFSISSRPALRLTQPPIQWVPADVPRGKAIGA
jgi:hypothetical protein